MSEGVNVSSGSSQSGDAASDLAARLLDAHVAHTLRTLDGDRFAALVEEEVAHILAASSQLTLDDVVRRDQVSAVAVKYVSTFRLPGAIPEIVGRIATAVRAHPANDVALGDLVGRARVDELVTVIAEMRALRLRFLSGLADSAALQAGVGDAVHDVAAGAIETGRRLLKRVPLVSQGVDIAGVVTAPVVSPLSAALDQRSRELAEHGAKVVLGYLGDSAAERVSDSDLRAGLLEVWDALATSRVGDLLDGVSDDEFIDLFVALYDIWEDLRSADYLPALVSSGVDVFFDTYGGFTLDALLAEFGLGPADVVTEALRFAPSVLTALRETGLLEAGIRRHLARFYDSPEARALLG